MAESRTLQGGRRSYTEYQTRITTQKLTTPCNKMAKDFVGIRAIIQCVSQQKTSKTNKTHRGNYVANNTTAKNPTGDYAGNINDLKRRQWIL